MIRHRCYSALLASYLELPDVSTHVSEYYTTTSITTPDDDLQAYVPFM